MVRGGNGPEDLGSIMRVDGLRKENARAWAEVERLRKGIKGYLDGDYEPKVKKMDKCPHDIYGYEVCENCIDEHFRKLLESNGSL